MLVRSSEAGQTTSDVAESIHQLLLLVEEQLGEIQQASMTAEEMKAAMDEVMYRARERFDTVRGAPNPSVMWCSARRRACSCSTAAWARSARSSG